MKRIQEKVKDLVEVRSYKSLRDFISDPEQTLTTYHFTDVTSEMMAKWIDRIAQPQAGVSKAVAGYRGVGKSHFLATLGAIVSNPEFRSRIGDAHVTASAEQLKRRKYPLAHVRRGTHESLFEEMKAAVTETFGSILPEGNVTAAEVIEKVLEKCGDLPFILIIDTAFDRAARVSRDDGIFLGELAEITKNKNVFTAVALDDDIAGADGINAAIAHRYTIDYLDQEHLYRIVDTNIFPKNHQARQVLRELYQEFRAVMPGFRWSEQRFSSLYPLHPSILEIAPYIRLYAPEFAMLGFASEAGAKVLGRPANSLVGLDEVFDRTETSLRKAADLQDAFKAYDRLGSEIVEQIPIMQRLEAKLVLKALLLLSLNGEGTTAAEISASMMIYRENEVESSVQRIEDLLEKFAAAVPEYINHIPEAGRSGRFGLKISGKDDLNNALTEAARKVSNESIGKVMRRFARDRFQDWTISSESEATADIVESRINWRGGYRIGAVLWNFDGELSANGEAKSESDLFEWSVIVRNAENTAAVENRLSELPPVVWQTDVLKPGETDTLKRYYALLNDEDLRKDFGSQIRAAGHALQSSVETVWNRVFIEQGKFIIDGQDYVLTKTAEQAENLSELLSEMLPPLFEKRFELHPVFETPPDFDDISTVISDHFSGAKPLSSEVQGLVKRYALPLGLVTLSGGNYVSESEENVLSLPAVKAVTELLDNNHTTVPMQKIDRALKAAPYGLTVESRCLILAALVARRRIEFVTTTGDRINRRSLDLKIIWEDISGVALPLSTDFTDAELLRWANLLTNTENKVNDADSPNREKIRDALFKWLEEGKAEKVLAEFEILPGEVLNSKIVKYATHVKKAFSAAVDAVESALGGRISLEEGLRRVADSFLDSTEEFAACSEKLETLEKFAAGIDLRQRVWEYIAVCEKTGDKFVDDLQEAALSALRQVEENPTGLNNLLLDNVWRSFHGKFSEYFASKHDTVMRSHLLRERFDKIIRSDEWWEFENLSEIKFFRKKYFNRAVKLSERFRELNCDFDVREMLKTHPFCACSFRLAQIDDWEKLPDLLLRVVEEGRNDYRKTLALMAETLIPLLKVFAEKEIGGEYREAANSLVEFLKNPVQTRLLNNAELTVLRKAAGQLQRAPVIPVTLPNVSGLADVSELGLRLTRWLDQMPSEPCLLKVE